MALRFIAFFTTIVFFFVAPAFAQSPPSAYEFFKPSENYDLELSPNGRLVSFIQTKNKKYCIDRYGKMVESAKSKCKDKNQQFRTTYTAIVYDLDTHKHIKVLPLPENHYIGWMAWASDDRLLVSIVATTTIGNGGRSYSLGGSRIISVDLSDGKGMGEHTFAVLFGDEKSIQRQNRHLSRVSNLLHNDSKHVMMPAVSSGDLDLWRVNVEDGSSTRIATGKPGTFYWYTDKAGMPVLRFDCQGRRCRKIRVYSPEDETGKWKKVRTFKTKPGDDTSDYDFWPIAPTDNPDQFYVMSDDEEDERRSIKIYDVKSETYVRTVYEHATADLSGALIDNDTGDYIGAYFYEDRRNYHFTDARLQKHYNGINTYFGNKANVRILGYNNDKTKAVVYMSATDSPGAYYVYDFNSANMKLIFDTEPDLTKALKTESEILEVTTRDGQKITAYRSYPKGKKHAKLPLLVMPHGGPESRDYFDFDITPQYFVARGYQTIQMNFRGSSGQGKKFAEAGYRQWGGVMQNDVTDTVKHLFSRQLATADNTCIVGYSYGGYAALYGGASTPELYKCVVSGGGISDLILSVKNTRKEYGSDSETLEYWKKSIGDPKLHKAELQEKSPVNMVDRIEAPVLLIHGQNDDNVYAEQSRIMKKALEKAGKPVEMLILEDEGHRNWDLETQILYHETIEAFLLEHLTGQQP